MAYQKKTNLFKTILFSRTTALVILFAIVFMVYGLVSLAGKSIEAAKARKLAESQASELREKRTALSTKLDALNTPDGKEAILREQFPVVKPGEHMVVISDDKPAALPPEPASQNENGGFWNFLKNLFK